MGAMRFGFMPSVKKNYGGATSYKTMVEQEDAKSIGSKDPAGFTAVDVLAAGSFATIISAGEILARQVRTRSIPLSLSDGMGPSAKVSVGHRASFVHAFVAFVHTISFISRSFSS